jgi:hypothetical protein
MPARLEKQSLVLVLGQEVAYFVPLGPQIQASVYSA